MCKFILMLLMGAAFPVVAETSAATADLDNIELTDLIGLDTAIGDIKPTSARVYPALVTVITGEEIRALGARDLDDVLLLLPGVAFGVDGFNLVAPAVRGLWASDGKFAVLIDGVAQNDLLYGTYNAGNRISMDQIDRVEFIRGPGSGVYVDNAQVGSINIITKGGRALKGCELTGSYGTTAKAWSRQNFSGACGSLVDGTEYSVSTYSGFGRRSDRIYQGFATDGTTPNSRVDDLSESENNRLDPNIINVGVHNRKLDLRYIREVYHTTSIDFGGMADGTTRGGTYDYEQTAIAARYHFNLTDRFKIVPSLVYRNDHPWKTVDIAAQNVTIQNQNVSRIQGNLVFVGDIGAHGNAMIGLEAYRERIEDYSFLTDPVIGGTDPYIVGGGKSYDSRSVYFQSLLEIVDRLFLTLGGRYEDHSVGGVFTPRFGLTKYSDSWHFKLLASDATHPPPALDIVVHDQANRGFELKPEVTTTYELEGGLALGFDNYLTANIFRTKIRNPIIYDYNYTSGDFEDYYNVSPTTVQGLEGTFTKKGDWAKVNFTYSYYEAVARSQIYRVPQDYNAVYSFPQHKFTLWSIIDLGASKFTVTPSVIYLGERYDRQINASMTDLEPRESDPLTLLNLYFSKEDFLIKGFSLGFGIYNIFNSNYALSQPYELGTLGNGEHPPLPTMAREYLVKVGYDVAF